jgi:hypothetical protein
MAWILRLNAIAKLNRDFVPNWDSVSSLDQRPAELCSAWTGVGARPHTSVAGAGTRTGVSAPHHTGPRPPAYFPGSLSSNFWLRDSMEVF